MVNLVLPSSDWAVQAEHVSKKFAQSLKRAMMYGLVDLARAALIPHSYRSALFGARMQDASCAQRGAPSGSQGIGADAGPLRSSEFWALRDVSFEVRRGECLGIVGHNGAGKSTLFSILSGIYAPTSGVARVRGRLQALIALGAGFHPTLTGRENIFLSAAIYGMTRRQIDDVYEDIIAFADIGDFIDMPVKNYSSGMMVRLGFAAAIHLKPDVLIIDEVLAVGDHAFRLKCNKRMGEVLSSGVPILFVSHMPQAVEAIATRVMWLDHGRVVKQGDPREVLLEYGRHMDRLVAAGGRPGAGFPARTGPLRIERVQFLDDEGRDRDAFDWNETICVRMHYGCSERASSAHFSVRLGKTGVWGGVVTQASMSHDCCGVTIEPGTGCVDCRFPHPGLTHGRYEVHCSILRSPTITTGLMPYQDPFLAGTFLVEASAAQMGLPGVMLSLRGDLPAISLAHDWTVK